MTAWPELIGDPAAEHAAVHASGGFSGGMSGLFWAVGRDSITYLQSVLSQDIEAMAPGDVSRSFLLQPRGKLEALLWVLRGEDRVGIVTDGGRQDETIRLLSRWRLRVDVEFEPDQRGVFDVWGPAHGMLDVGEGWRDRDGIMVAQLRDAPVGHRIVAGLDVAGLESRRLVPIGDRTDAVLRIETGEPRMGIDVDGRTIPQETGLVPDAVSFTKGCFLGQELVARINSRGRVNRHLRGIRVLDATAPPPGAQIVHGGKVVGTLTSVGVSPTLGAPVALALIRREAPPGTQVTVSWEGNETQAVVESLPLIQS